MLRTNFLMLNDLLEVYHPQTKGIVTMTELYLINEKLHMDEMDEIQLRNLRDFTVIYLNSLMDGAEEEPDKVLELHDKMSAIVAAIDQKLWNMGKEV